MFRKTTGKQQATNRHTFSLQPRSEYVLHPHKYRMSFGSSKSCGKSMKIMKGGRSSSCQNYPTFNKDCNYASPTFILRAQIKYYQSEKQSIKKDYEQKHLEQIDQIDSLHIPKPKSKNNYCSVCHTAYEDYLEHIGNNLHTQKVKKSPFNKHILELVQFFKQINKQPSCKQLSTQPTQPAQPTQQAISAQIIQANQFSSDSDEVQIIQNPKKKFKKDKQIENNQTNFQKRDNFFLPYYNRWFLNYEAFANFYQQKTVNFFYIFTNAFSIINPPIIPRLQPATILRMLNPPQAKVSQQPPQSRGREKKSNYIVIDD